MIRFNRKKYQDKIFIVLFLLLLLECLILSVLTFTTTTTTTTNNKNNDRIRRRGGREVLRMMALLDDKKNAGEGDNKDNDDEEKTITFLRHGCTYMNEYLAGADGGRRFGHPGFTDIFTDPRRRQKYQDSPLSTLGRQQAHRLYHDNKELQSYLQTQCELIVTSPLTRALQTLELGLLGGKGSRPSSFNIPIVAVPEAAERLYLISDVGRCISELRDEFHYVDFDTHFCAQHHDSDNADIEWWYKSSSESKSSEYVEWRPTGMGQKYACPGEPPHEFDSRMHRLYGLLRQREEKNIIVVCHHGVIDWFLDMDFDNCQYRHIPMSEIQPRRNRQST